MFRNVLAAVNVAFALSVACWGLLGLCSAPPGGLLGPVPWAIAALHACVALLFLRRAPARRVGSWISIVMSVPGVAVGGLALSLCPPPSQWATPAQWLFSLGAAVTILTLFQLGSSFAVLPSLRCVVVRGPYRLIRHPAYFAELVMLCACFHAATHPWVAAVLAPCAVGVVAMRIIAEERILRTSPEYRRYTARVRWRLLPGAW